MDLRQVVVSLDKIGKHLQRLFETGDGSLIIPMFLENGTQIVVCFGDTGVDLNNPPVIADSSVQISILLFNHTAPEVGFPVIGIDLSRLAIACQRRLHVARSLQGDPQVTRIDTVFRIDMDGPAQQPNSRIYVTVGIRQTCGQMDRCGPLRIRAQRSFA